MKGKWALVVVAAGLLSLSLASGLANAQAVTGKAVVKTVGNVQVEFIAPESGLVTGDNAIAVQLKDTTTGKAIVQNAVRVEVTMDTGDKSMGGMDMSSQKPVVADLKADTTVAGRYSGKVNLSSAGMWNAKVFVDAQRSTIIGVNVTASGPNWLLIGGVVGIVALGIAAIAVLKRKPGVGSVTESATEPA